MHRSFVIAACLLGAAYYFAPGTDNKNNTPAVDPSERVRLDATIDKTIPAGDCAQIGYINHAVQVVNNCPLSINVIFCSVAASQDCSWITLHQPIPANHRMRVGFAWTDLTRMEVAACYFPYKPVRRTSAQTGYTEISCLRQ